jgi:hypothetical protein
MTQQAMKRLFCQISKVDEEARTVTGVGTSEALDAEGEICDYPSSKPYIEAWSAAAVARSAGKSYGNIREMHQPSAVGKLAEPILFDDGAKRVTLTSYISDDDAWKKCLDGTYTGFSICGPIIGEKWSDPNVIGAKRFTCAPIEFSVCDLPCNPEAFFTAVKVGGVTEVRKFKTAAAVETEPIVAKTLIAQKSMYSIADLSSIISSLRWVQDDLVYERDYEGDGSPVPDKLKAAITALCDVLVDLAREESSELVGAMKVSKVIEDMKKAGAKKLAAPKTAVIDPATVPAVDPAAKAAGAPQSTGASPETGEQTPMDEAQKAQLAAAEKNAAESLEIAKRNEESIKSLGESFAKGLETILKSVSSEPVAAKSAGAGAPVTTVAKEGDNGGAAAAPATTQSKDPVEIAKSILASGGRPIERNEALHIGR